MNWVKIYGPEILQLDDFISQVSAAGKKLCIIKSNGTIRATQPYCPHAGASLSGGYISGGKLVCPYHRYEYDIDSGKGNPEQGDYLDIYPVEIREDGVYVGLKISLLRRFFGTP